MTALQIKIDRTMYSLDKVGEEEKANISKLVMLILIRDWPQYLPECWKIFTADVPG